MSTIVVQISDFEWTKKAMHLACAMARHTGMPLVLLDLRPVKTPALLGTGLSSTTPTEKEYEQLNEYWMIAEDYGVTFAHQPMEYETLANALAQAAEYLNACILFAYLPQRPLSLWNRLEKWTLRRQMAGLDCRLFTLDQPEQLEEWMPTVSYTAVH